MPPACSATLGTRPAAATGNDGTIRTTIWRRHGDDWAAFDALPSRIRQRLCDHTYDARAVNALLLWRRFRRLYAGDARAELALLRYLGHCERLERRAFSDNWRARWGTPFPHDAAGVDVLRASGPGAGPSSGPRGPHRMGIEAERRRSPETMPVAPAPGRGRCRRNA